MVNKKSARRNLTGPEMLFATSVALNVTRNAYPGSSYGRFPYLLKSTIQKNRRYPCPIR